MKLRYRLGAGPFTTDVNQSGVRACTVCLEPFPQNLRIDTEDATGKLHTYCFVHYKQSMGVAVKRRAVSFEDLPSAVSFTAINSGGRNPEDLFEDGDSAVAVSDPGIEEAGKEDSLLFILKTLAKDRYRVLALMLYLREQGFAFRYEDIASIWGFDKAMVRMTMKRMQATLKKAGITEDGLFTKR